MKNINFVDSENNTLTLSKSIEEYLESEKFYNSLNALNEIFKKSSEHANIKVLDYIFGTIIAYHVIFYDESEDVNNDLHELVDSEIKYIANLDLNEEFNVFGFDSSEIDDVRNFILDLFLKQIKNKNLKIDDIISKKYIFHSFNSTFLESIRENGINPEAKQRQEMRKDICILEKIGDKYNIGHLLSNYNYSWDFEVCYSRNPFVSYGYAQTSPEWFFHFAGGSTSFSRLQMNCSEYAFAVKDYNSAKNNIMKLMDAYEFKGADRNTFLLLFNKYWKMFDNEYNNLMIIPKTNVSRAFSDSEDCPKMMLKNYLFSFGDGQTSKKIDVKNAICVKLPNVSTIYKKLGINKNNTISK